MGYRIKMEGRTKVRDMSPSTESFVLSLKSNLSFRIRTEPRIEIELFTSPETMKGVDEITNYRKE